MPKNEEPADCQERERLLAEVRDAIRQTIRTRDQPDANAALKAWRDARSALMHHMKKHGC